MSTNPELYYSIMDAELGGLPVADDNENDEDNLGVETTTIPEPTEDNPESMYDEGRCSGRAL